MMKTHLDANLKDWIAENLKAGSDKNVLFNLLQSAGYDTELINRELNLGPVVVVQAPLVPGLTKDIEQTPENYGACVPLNRLVMPKAKRLDTALAELYTVDGVLSPKECAEIVALIRSKNQRSTLSSHEADQTFRTSRTCQLGHLESPLMKDVDKRLCKLLGIHSSYGEVIQGQYYEIGQEFKPHTDYFELHEIATHGQKMGQRTFTCMVYLNDVPEGGETVYPKLEQCFKPKAGMAVIWNSLNPDGSPNYFTLHHATAVKKGFKAVITKWFRSNSALDQAPGMFTKKIR